MFRFIVMFITVVFFVELRWPKKNSIFDFFPRSLCTAALIIRRGIYFYLTRVYEIKYDTYVIR